MSRTKYPQYHSHYLSDKIDCPFDGIKYCDIPCSISCWSIEECVEHLKDGHGILIKQPFSLVFIMDQYLKFWASFLRNVDGANTIANGVISDGARTQIQEAGLAIKSPLMPQEKDKYGRSFFIEISGRKDEQIRRELHELKLKEMLKIQECERQRELDGPNLKPEQCLFCMKNYSGYAQLFDHLHLEHHLKIGLPQNLVMIGEYFKVLRDLLKRNICVYCERTFPDPMTLRRHMRKKKHFQVNPRNPLYDKFYIANYLDPENDLNIKYGLLETIYDDSVDHSMESHSSSPSSISFADTDYSDDLNRPSFAHMRIGRKSSLLADFEENEADEWSGEIDPEEKTQCLFCSHTETDPQNLLEVHMPEEHSFDMISFCKNQGFDIYQRIKLVNYIRRCSFRGVCISCGSEFSTNEELSKHYSNSKDECCPIFLAKKQTLWDDQQYLIPTYEDDPIFQALDFDSDHDDERTSQSLETRIDDLSIQ